MDKRGTANTMDFLKLETRTHQSFRGLKVNEHRRSFPRLTEWTFKESPKIVFYQL